MSVRLLIALCFALLLCGVAQADGGGDRMTGRPFVSRSEVIARHGMAATSQPLVTQVANRPGRIEPRVLKRRRHRYPLMQRPRDELRAELGKT